MVHLFARDREGCLVAASEANKSCDYRCRECGEVVRRRCGGRRQSHFFHLNPSPSCRLSGKSLVHLQVQRVLKSMFPHGESFLEHRFESIDRIADVAWISRNLVFEIQCSPISEEEVSQRCSDYEKVGCDVVWILHERCYNSRVLTPAERFLRGRLYYYTNMDVEGRGCIYDQADLVVNDRRVMTVGTVKPVLALPRKVEKSVLQETRLFPRMIQERIRGANVYFEKDLLCRCLSGNPDALIEKWLQQESSQRSPSRCIAPRRLSKLMKGLGSQILTFYDSLLRYFLEKASRV